MIITTNKITFYDNVRFVLIIKKKKRLAINTWIYKKTFTVGEFKIYYKCNNPRFIRVLSFQELKYIERCNRIYSL